MKKYSFIVFVFSFFTLSAQQGINYRGTGNDYSSYEQALDEPYTNNYRNVNPAFYYGYGWSDPNNQGSQPGESDDSDALYASYLKTNPPFEGI